MKYLTFMFTVFASMNYWGCQLLVDSYLMVFIRSWLESDQFPIAKKTTTA